jgi:hypothetical protein
MKKVFAITLALIFSPAVASSEIVFDFNSPSFNGQGYGTHVLTIHQLEQQRKDKIKADKQAEIDRIERDYRNTNEYKFLNNLESRIYAQLSRQIADSMFGEGAEIIDGEWYDSQTPFGDTISWKREDDRIYVSILDSNGDVVAEFDVPIGEFAF